MQGIRVRMPEIRVGMRALIGVGNAGMQGFKLGMRGIRPILYENLRVYCFG